MGSQFGQLFQISTWGESHGGGVGVVVDGCPAQLPLDASDIQPQLDRRRPGQSRLVTPRQEADAVQILSGTFEGQTIGTPILLMVENQDARPGAYEKFRDLYRPSHADFTYDAKYGVRNWQGGGRSSARETVGRVAAGAIAEKILALAERTRVVAYVTQIGKVRANITEKDALAMTRKKVDRTPVRCPDPEAAEKMIRQIEKVRRAGDSVGGILEVVVRNVPVGLGDPVFDKLEADLAKARMSLPATKGFEFGSGFAGTQMKGSEHNDAFVRRKGQIRTETNRSGGIQGGISNGEPIVFRVAFKPTATIRMPQKTVDSQGRSRTIEARGRHDPCVLPRAVPLVEAMASLVLVDHWLRQLAATEATRRFSTQKSERK